MCGNTIINNMNEEKSIIFIFYPVLLILFLILFILTTCQTLTIIFPTLRKILDEKNNIFVQICAKTNYIFWFYKVLEVPFYNLEF